jgi:CBS domain-containing protein
MAQAGLTQARRYAPHSMRTVADVMTRDLVSVHAGATLTEAAKEMSGRRVGAALVFEEERIAGILTERDVLRAAAEERIEGTTVADWMTRHPETVEPDDSTSTAATLMIHGGFRHLPVLDGESVVGIVSIRDLMRVVLDDEAPRGV